MFEKRGNYLSNLTVWPFTKNSKAEWWLFLEQNHLSVKSHHLDLEFLVNGRTVLADAEFKNNVYGVVLNKNEIGTVPPIGFSLLD